LGKLNSKGVVLTKNLIFVEKIEGITVKNMILNLTVIFARGVVLT